MVKSRCNRDCSLLVKRKMVPESDVRRSSGTGMESPQSDPVFGQSPKTWGGSYLLGAALVPSALAPSTLRTYNHPLQRLFHFCQSCGQEIPPVNENVLADFIVSLANAHCPKVPLKIVLPVLCMCYDARGHVMPTNSQEFTRLLTAAIKLCTSVAFYFFPVNFLTLYYVTFEYNANYNWCSLNPNFRQILFFRLNNAQFMSEFNRLVLHADDMYILVSHKAP